MSCFSFHNSDFSTNLYFSQCLTYAQLRQSHVDVALRFPLTYRTCIMDMYLCMNTHNEPSHDLLLYDGNSNELKLLQKNTTKLIASQNKPST